MMQIFLNTPKSQGSLHQLSTIILLCLMVLSSGYAFAGPNKDGEVGVTLHPGFEEGVPLGQGLVQSSIGLADIDQDGLDEIVVGGANGTLYGYNGDGSAVIEDLIGRPGALFTGLAGIYSTPTLADVDLDKRVDMFFGNDNGVLYHLELRLSSDSIGTVSKSLSIPAVLLPKATPKVAPAKGEEDDTGR